MKKRLKKRELPRGVIFNAYPDSIGENLEGSLRTLNLPEFQDAFSLFYILPTFFNSDLDRGFSIIDYELNKNLVSPTNLERLNTVKIKLKLDLVLNHLSVNSPQFQDLLGRGNSSEYHDFFIDWNKFWKGLGRTGPDGCIIPDPEYLNNLFTRKPGLPVMKISFPDGHDRFFWNTFYQETIYEEVTADDFATIEGITPNLATEIASIVNDAFLSKTPPEQINLGAYSKYCKKIMPVIEKKRRYLGQLDLNARSEKVWAFYDAALKKLNSYGAKIVRLDAFAYLHKEPGQSNFFNRPGTWEYLEQLNDIAQQYGLIVLPEIHSEYGSCLHEEIASRGYPIYDFFFPGLVIDALERGRAENLLAWIEEVRDKDYQTINMLGCHDGIPLLDLRGKKVDGITRPGLLSDEQINVVVKLITSRGGRIKNLYGPEGRKISYYQVNATFFSALGESEQKLLLARAIQLFMPGTPQVWYLDLFAGENDYEAADMSGQAGHKEINRTNLSLLEIEKKVQQPVVLDQLKMIKFRNNSPAFNGRLKIEKSADPSLLQLCWQNGEESATLVADLNKHSFYIDEKNKSGQSRIL